MSDTDRSHGFDRPSEYTRPSFDDDLSGLIQERRLSQIYERHDHVYNLNARLLAADVRVPDGQKNTILRQAVEDYISEVRYLMLHEAKDIGQQYWEDYPLGTIQFACPQQLREDLAQYSIVEQKPPATKRHELVGLQSLVEAPSVLSTEFTAKVPPVGGGDDGRLTEVATKQVPRQILLAARDAVNEFLGHLGVDFRVTDTSDDELFGPVSEDQWNESFTELVREASENGEFEDLLVEVDE